MEKEEFREVKRPRINLDRRLDPEWGSIIPRDFSAYRVDVLPYDEEEEEWDFFVLLPKYEIDLDSEEQIPLSEDDELFTLKKLCLDTLDKKLDFKIYALDMDNLKFYDSSSPVVSFDPANPGDLIWIVPPIFMRA